ncbi:hypothetical protein MtrunA17_Chr3g0134501 [Medicago truncatula]|uniref:PUM-HD domain-containing protein n=1 Tax=Medicago truncatula TaxID=3880 RepID=A0A396IYZ7_MEDTR|nr:pumilio homolog 15 [Medicago truncatula]RHN70342.1 hypothetical protein MtrunA17_Chr3g0134501 [Medicago truncatula]
MSNNRFIPNDSVDNGDSPLSPRSQWFSYIASLTQNQNQNNNHNQNPFMSQIENPNQTLEQAFSRLSVANPNPNQSFGYGVANNLNDYDYSGLGVSVNPYYNYNYGIQLSNPSQPDFNRPVRNNNNIAYGRGISSPSPRLSSYDVNQIRYNHLNGGIGGGGYGNDMFYGSEELMRNFQCALRNESSVPTWVNDGVNVNNVNVNGMSAHWFDEFRGRVYSLAKDTHGSKILQEVMENLGPEGVSYFFLELINHMCELMVDPIGYEVITKMVEVCNQDQKTQIVLLVTHHGAQFIRICLSLHGSRSVEKLLEKVTTREQRGLIMSALTPGAIVLSKDINGHRVVFNCLKNFPHADTEKFLGVIARNSLSLSRDKTGCCVLQYCVSHAQGATKNLLIHEIILHAPLLAEDCYGNYVIQHLISLKIPTVSGNLHHQLQQQFVSLSCNKYGSNVVEKFLHDSGVDISSCIIIELLNDPNVTRLLTDPYGNFVISTALNKFKGARFIKNALEELVEANSQMMRSNMFGKKVLDKFEGKNRRNNI